MMISESELQALLLLRAPREIPILRLFRRQVMVARKQERTIRVGIKGQCDLYGIYRMGQHIELELKSAVGKLTFEQKHWQGFCYEWGIPHCVLQANKNESAEETVSRWIILLSRQPVD